MMGGSEAEAEAEQKQRNIPKLQILNPPTMMMHSPERPGMKTPPLYSSSVSVPFGWEEEPGKPRPCLEELPPRLMLFHDDDDVDGDDVPTKLRKLSSKFHSPNTVLEGPYMSSNNHQSPSFRILSKGVWIKEKMWFGSWRRKKDFKVRREMSWGSDVFPSSYADSVAVTESSHKNVNITKIKHYGSFYNMFNANLWRTISGGLKQVVPRRSKSLKKDG